MNASFVALRELPWASREDATPVCLDEDTVLGFDAFKVRVSTYASWLGGKPGLRVAVCLDDPFEFACALFAVLACGKEPIVPSMSAPAYLAMLGPCYDVLLTAAELPLVDACEMPVMPGGRIDADAPLTLYTSGSSGVPKAVRKTLAQFDAEVRTLETQWGALLGQTPMLASVPHRHIYGLLFRIFWPLAAGRPFDRASCMDPLQLQARLERVGRAAVVSSPSQLDRWTELPGFDTLAPAPSVYFSSGGPLSEQTADTYARRFGAAPVEIYGSTETGGIAWRRRDVSDAWQGVPGVELKCDEDGALVVRSPHLGHDDWYRTDDAVAFDEDGRFRLKGRLDRIVKLDGKRVSLPEIEAHLARHPYVAQAAAVVLPGAVRERLGVLIALTREGSAALLGEGRVALAKRLRRHLADYVEAVVLPRRWRFCAALPFDARGKLPSAAIAAAFDVHPQGMEVLAQFAHEDAQHYELRVPPSLVHFDGHFPGLPILPGVVQIDWAVQLGAEHWPEVRSMLAVERLKFMAPVPPGAILHLTLAHDAVRRKMRFAFRFGERDSASGIVAYRGAA
ncbi:AMP-binding protein [Trinickia dinghuensis]|uniref:AMP-dependent synthetase n=1 Tax=Trinickia dinghuensis TaxID=2291023 RepID=A0A3D8JSM6_9BURK|nr:AMP-binding protein [Trinickia dinghuensis]RDU95676.1 AMP-dependent synthetase [Trinickia dinghuensis]